MPAQLAKLLQPHLQFTYSINAQARCAPQRRESLAVEAENHYLVSAALLQSRTSHLLAIMTVMPNSTDLRKSQALLSAQLCSAEPRSAAFPN